MSTSWGSLFQDGLETGSHLPALPLALALLLRPSTIVLYFWQKREQIFNAALPLTHSRSHRTG